MKHAVRILSLFLITLLLIATLTACAKPAKTPEKASAALKEEGFVVVLDTRVLPDIFSALGYDLGTALSASKTVTDADGNKTVEHLTVFYFDSKKDAKNAVYYYRMAAEQGNIDAIYRLGAAYAEGFGVRRDFKAAESFFGIAAKQGYRDSAARIETIKRVRHKKKAQKVYSISSVLYRKGEVSEAIRFRSVAAKLGNPRAMYALGCHYEFGDGVPMDRDRAQGWYTYAGNAGFKISARSDYKGGFLRERKLLFLRKKNG